jgi:hypothetical protein
MKFSEFVETYSVNLVKFAQKAGISWPTLHRLYRRKHANITLVVAKKIVKGSKNKVTFLDLAKEVEEIMQEIRHTESPEETTMQSEKQ